jgi:hypothetical protein
MPAAPPALVVPLGAAPPVLVVLVVPPISVATLALVAPPVMAVSLAPVVPPATGAPPALVMTPASVAPPVAPLCAPPAPLLQPKRQRGAAIRAKVRHRFVQLIIRQHSRQYLVPSITPQLAKVSVV